MKKNFLKILIIMAIVFCIKISNVNAMQIFVRTQAGGNITLDVEPTDTIANLKTKIQDKIDVVPEQQKLMYANNVLDDSLTIQYYNIGRTDTIHIFLINKITINEMIHGEVSSEHTSYCEGDTITLAIKPDTGYKLKTISSVPSISLVEVNATTYTFEMPNEAIVINAEFEWDYTYEIISGANSKVNTNTNENIVVAINGNYELLDKVYVNDEELNSTNYASEEGSTIITLKKDYLKSLTPGTYNIKVTYTNDEEATTTFIVEESIVNPKTSDSIMNYLMLGIISLIGIIICSLLFNKKCCYN